MPWKGSLVPFIFFSMFFFLLCCRKNAELPVDQTGTTPQPPVILTMFNAESKPFDWNYQNPVARQCIAKTGVIIDMEYGEGNFEDSLPLMLADRTYREIMYSKGYLDEFIAAGVFLPLDELIEKYGPNIKKFYGKNLKRLRYKLEDPSIYYLGSFPIEKVKPEAQGGFFLQLDVIQTLGYPRMRSVQDFEEAIRKYIRQNPEIDGKPAIGLSLNADDWRFLISVTNPAFFTTGAPDDGEWYIDPQTYEAILHYRRPIEREYFRWLNHMNDTGLLDPESFVQTYEQYLAKIAEGRVLGLIDARWDVAGTEATLRANGRVNRTYGVFPVTLNEACKHTEFYPAAYSSRWGISLTERCSDPVAAIKFFDYLLSEEGQILVHWGVEGIHYEIDQKGKRYFTSGQVKLRNIPNVQAVSGIYMFSYPFPEYGQGILDSTGQPFVPPVREEKTEEIAGLEIEVLNAYGVEYWSDLYPPESTFPVRPYGIAWQIEFPEKSEARIIFNRCQEIIRQRITESILTTPAQFDVTWELMLQELKTAGVEKMEQEFTRMVRNIITLWEE